MFFFGSSYVEPWLVEGGFGENRQIEITVKVEENPQPWILASGTIQLRKKILGNHQVKLQMCDYMLIQGEK